MKRKRLTRKQKVDLFDRDNGHCWRCGLRIDVSQKWEVGHKIALALGGEDEWDNMAPEHVHCNREDGHKVTTKAAKGVRIRANLLGIKKEPKRKPWKPTRPWVRHVEDDLVHGEEQ